MPNHNTEGVVFLDAILNAPRHGHKTVHELFERLRMERAMGLRTGAHQVIIDSLGGMDIEQRSFKISHTRDHPPFDRSWLSDNMGQYVKTDKDKPLYRVRDVAMGKGPSHAKPKNHKRK